MWMVLEALEKRQQAISQASAGRLLEGFSGAVTA